MCTTYCLTGWVLKKSLLLCKVHVLSKDHNFNSHYDHCLWWFSSAAMFVMCQLVWPFKLGFSSHLILKMHYQSGWTVTNICSSSGCTSLVERWALHRTYCKSRELSRCIMRNQTNYCTFAQLCPDRWCISLQLHTTLSVSFWNGLYHWML